MSSLKAAVAGRNFEQMKERIQASYGVAYKETVLHALGTIHILDGICEGDPEYPKPSYRTIWLTETRKGWIGRPLYFDHWSGGALLKPAPPYGARKAAALKDAEKYIGLSNGR